MQQRAVPAELLLLLQGQHTWLAPAEELGQLGTYLYSILSIGAMPGLAVVPGIHQHPGLQVQ